MTDIKWNLKGIMDGQNKRIEAYTWLGGQIVLGEIIKKTPVDEGGLKAANNMRRISGDYLKHIIAETKYV